MKSSSASKSKMSSVDHDGSKTSAPRNSTRALLYNCLFGGGYWWNMLLKAIMLSVSIIPMKIPSDIEIKKLIIIYEMATTLAAVESDALMSLKVSSRG